jgi:hypothetical protein
MLAAARSIRLSVPLLCELALPLVVQLELGHDALAKDGRGREKSVELVQRVGAAAGGAPAQSTPLANCAMS